MDSMTEHEIYMAIKSGVTPKALQAAYDSKGIRALHYSTYVPQHHLFILKERWGISPTRHFKCPHCKRKIGGVA